MIVENGKQWLTVTEACQALNMTERTVRRYIKEGKYPSKIESGRRLVLIEVQQANHDTQQAAGMTVVMAHMRNENQFLREDLQARNRQIEQLENELAESSKRHDAIIMQLTQQLDRAHLQLEDSRQRRTVWQRIRAVFVAESV